MNCSRSTAPGAAKRALLLCGLTLALSGCAASAVRTGGPAPAPRTPGAIVTNDWSYERAGEQVIQHGQWLHLPADEAGDLLLWLENAEGLCR